MKHQKESAKTSLPLYGVGPLYVGVISVVTVLAVILDIRHLIPSLRYPQGTLMLLVTGVALIISGVMLWIYAVVLSKIDDGIMAGRLVTHGAYACVRNPIYTAFLMLCTGILLIRGNLACLLLPFVYGAFLTVLLQHSEERWLHARFGEAYEAYCQHVNRIIPGVPHGERLYESDISDFLWIIYDLPGNIGWILYIVSWYKMMMSHRSPLMMQVVTLGGLPVLMMIIGIIELLNERVHKLDRVLTRRRLVRGFGMLFYGGSTGCVIACLLLVMGLRSWQTFGMLGGGVLCALFAGLLYRRYQPRS